MESLTDLVAAAKEAPELARFLVLIAAIKFVSQVFSAIFFSFAEFFGTIKGRREKPAKYAGKTCWLLGRIFMSIGYGVPKRYKEALVMQNTKPPRGDCG